MALDQAYQIMLTPSKNNNEAVNQSNFDIVKNIRFARIPKDTKIVTNIEKSENP